MIKWSELSVERKIEISKNLHVFIRNKNRRPPSISAKKEIFQKPNGTKISFTIFDINDTLGRNFGSYDVKIDHSNFDELYDFCILNPFFKNHLLQHLGKFKTKRMAIKGMLVNSRIYMFLSDKLKSDPDILKLALRSKRGCALKNAPKKILSSNKYFELLASEQIDVIRFFDKKILNNPKNFSLIVSKLHRIRNISTIDCLPETLKRAFLIQTIKDIQSNFYIARKLSPKWLLKNCGNSRSSYLKMYEKSTWTRAFQNDAGNKYFKALLNMKNAKGARAAAILTLVVNQIENSHINTFFNVVINLINHPVMNKYTSYMEGYKSSSPFEIANYNQELKNLGFNTSFVKAVRNTLDMTGDTIFSSSYSYSDEDIPF